MRAAQIIAAVRRHPIWSSASERGVRALIEHSEALSLGPGKRILTAGEPADRIHLLLDGAVRVFYPATEEQSEVTVKLFWAPAAFGDAESILRAKWAETVETLTGVDVIITPADAYFRLMQAEPTVCFRQYWDVSRRFGVAIRTERAANFDELRDRLVALFIAYAQHFGAQVESGTQIEFPLTQDMLAKQVSSNRRSIVRVLANLYDRKLVLRKGRRFVIPSLQALLESTRSESPELSFRTDLRPWAERG